MTEEEKDARIREIITRYRSEIDAIRKEFRKEIGEILADIKDRKLGEIKSKLEIND